MASEPKLRPSMSVRQLTLISESIDFRVTELVKAGQTNNPILLELLQLKTYCDSLQPKQTNAQALLAQYLQQNSQCNSVTAHSAQAAQPASVAIIESSTISPLDQPDLTDEQRLDLLELRKDSERTERENIWYLNVGTLIKMQRMQRKPVTTNDL